MSNKITHRPLLKRGRKLKVPPQDCAEAIEALAADGWSQLGIAKRLGTSADTLRRWLDENPALQEAFNTGRENERHALHNMLYRQAMEAGNATAAMFLLKSRHGYREGDQSETANKVTINFQLPGAMSMEQFEAVKVIEQHGNADDRNESVSAARAVVARRG
jgi:hypothetical protein